MAPSQGVSPLFPAFHIKAAFHRPSPSFDLPFDLPFPVPSLQLTYSLLCMGLDVMSRYGPRRVHHDAMASCSLTVSSDSPPSMSDALSPAKSLTPQRKHHKLLKDGSEVWSEDVEKIFVEGSSIVLLFGSLVLNCLRTSGLREYWESPWATYSRGRSRWRNQFLVDHLKKYGIERSKKQVASHIQVLRNMWREQPGSSLTIRERSLPRLTYFHNRVPFGRGRGGALHGERSLGIPEECTKGFRQSSFFTFYAKA